MIANYGYEDGSGFYYITVDGSICGECAHHGCVDACPRNVYAMEMNDYDENVAVVREEARRRLRELCSTCKGQDGGGGSQHTLPCTSACPAGALQHSW